MKKAVSHSQTVRVVLDETSKSSVPTARSLRDSVASDMKVLRKFISNSPRTTQKENKS